MPRVLPEFHSATQNQKYTFSSECTGRPFGGDDGFSIAGTAESSRTTFWMPYLLRL